MSTALTRFEEVARDLAVQRSLYLYRLAVDAVKRGEVDYARSLVAEALEILKRMRIKRPRVLKRMVCKNCLVPLIPGVTARVRIRDSTIVVTCLECGYIRRFPLARERRG